MPEQLIRRQGRVADHWQRIDAASEAAGDDGANAAAQPLPAGRVLISAELWLARRAELLGRAERGEIAVSLAPTFEPAALAEDLPRFPLIAVEFPKFTDGRGYSTARLLRERYAFAGELRAVGDVGRDQLFLLQRVGFDSFLLPDGRDADAALQAFADFPDVYQAAVDQPLPLFRRRAGVAAADATTSDLAPTHSA